MTDKELNKVNEAVNAQIGSLLPPAIEKSLADYEHAAGADGWSIAIKVEADKNPGNGFIIRTSCTSSVSLKSRSDAEPICVDFGPTLFDDDNVTE